MIKWLVSGLEEAYNSSEMTLGSSKVWDYLDMEMPLCTSGPAIWDDAPSPPLGTTSTTSYRVSDEELLWRNCMWGGRCSTHDHGRCESTPRPALTPPVPPTAPARSVGAGESLLKSSVLLRSQHPSPPPSPTPGGELPDSEKEMMFVSMTDVLCDVKWTACEPTQVSVKLEPGITAVSQVHEDHSYHLTKYSRPVCTDNLGVQTPSDSGTDDDFFEDEILEQLPDLDADDVDFFGPESVFKDIAESVAEELRPIKKESVSESESCHPMSDSEDEEIDVVSVVEKKPRALPNNPSIHDRHQLQQTVADAVVRRSGRRRHRHHRRHHRHHHRHHHRRRRDKNCRGKPGRKSKKYQSLEPPSELPTPASTADEGEGGSNKRSLHNNMERQRRIDLSNLVRTVRQLVPSICEKERAPRIVVLREAAYYCRQLQVEGTQLAVYKQELKLLNNRLRTAHQLALQNIPSGSLRNLRHVNTSSRRSSTTKSRRRSRDSY